MVCRCAISRYRWKALAGGQADQGILLYGGDHVQQRESVTVAPRRDKERVFVTRITGPNLVFQCNEHGPLYENRRREWITIRLRGVPLVMVVDSVLRKNLATVKDAL
ncbi:MAG: hypothetical protein K9N51_10055 [Candidatus Pacebacteria bacterium]|nr:hypothetical protein [Candidatus Paceibacterota bacterium]